MRAAALATSSCNAPLPRIVSRYNQITLRRHGAHTLRSIGSAAAYQHLLAGTRMLRAAVTLARERLSGRTGRGHG